MGQGPGKDQSDNLSLIAMYNELGRDTRNRMVNMFGGNDGDTPTAHDTDGHDEIIIGPAARAAKAAATNNTNDGTVIDESASAPVTDRSPAAVTDMSKDQAEPNVSDDPNQIIVEGPPYGIDPSFRISQNNILQDVKAISDLQANNPNAPHLILAYSEEAHSYLLLRQSAVTGENAVFQISDTNVAKILPGITDGSIALDNSAQRQIAERLHGNNPDTKVYTTKDLRDAFAEHPTRYTHDTRERLLTTTMERPDGNLNRFSIDDLHDALEHLDSKHDWKGSDDPIAMRDYIKDLKQAAEDAREERTVTLPEWKGGPLDYQNSVEVKLGDESVRIPLDVWQRIENQMTTTESRFSTGQEKSALVEVLPGDPDLLTVPFNNAAKDQGPKTNEPAIDTVPDITPANKPQIQGPAP